MFYILIGFNYIGAEEIDNISLFIVAFCIKFCTCSRFRLKKNLHVEYSVVEVLHIVPW